jgi:hypothetical protein
MRRRLFSGILVLGLTVLAASACSDDPTTPTTPTPPVSTTETFAGTLTVNGAVTFPFTSAAGDISAKLIQLTDGATVGISVGLASGTTCQMVISDDNAGFGSQIIGTMRESGTLCARVYDVGKLTGPITFTISVQHF